MKHAKFLIFFILICLILAYSKPVLAVDVGIKVGENGNITFDDPLGRQNLYYGIVNTGGQAGHLIKLQTFTSPSTWTDRFKVDKSGNVTASGFVDGSQLCIAGDCKNSWAGIGGSDGYIGDIQAHTAGGNLNMGSNAIYGYLHGASTGAPDATIWAVSGQYPNWGVFYNEGDPDYIEFKTGGTVSSRIALDTGAAHFGISGGNVGIGTTDPGSYKLNVDGTVSIGSSLAAGTDALNLHNTDIYGVNWLQINDPGEGIAWNGGASAVNLYVVDDANDNLLRTNLNFIVDGAVSIGATSLNTKLNVEGSARIKDTLQIENTDTTIYHSYVDYADVLTFKSSDSNNYGSFRFYSEKRNASDNHLALYYHGDSKKWRFYSSMYIHSGLTLGDGVNLDVGATLTGCDTCRAGGVIYADNFESYNGLWIRGNNGAGLYVQNDAGADISGDVKISNGLLKLHKRSSYQPPNCDSDNEGAMFYSTTANQPCFCNGSTWLLISDGSSECQIY